MTLFVINYLDYVHRVQENDYIEWDVKTLTSGDYTVETDIGNDFYPNYKKSVEKDWIKKSLNFCMCCKKC